ncbi:heterokaryon incompatibility protein-domain-containing protein [Dichomitus squalens]|uniref:Heterokaryon incompatibility protein-domain-containing protein n=1 Tax=Dichomitus squalens TaxID=114155 RepID=A0A4Q9ND32_9APHY|nr:heterokaryon incompatibility protein-domain-containing protein [Dichomitus squalens]TBU60257.1 heterokaryon incompatibility protein-domain-containing protein [Dichomitus squalens]
MRKIDWKMLKHTTKEALRIMKAVLPCLSGDGMDTLAPEKSTLEPLQARSPTPNPQLDAGSMALIRRLCVSCWSLDFSDICSGTTLYFLFPALPNQPGCNVCDFFRALHVDIVDRLTPILAEPPNTVPLNTTHRRAIRVEILKQVEVAPREHKGFDLAVFDASISDTWYGNAFKQPLYIRGCDSFDTHPAKTDGDGEPDTHAHGVVSTWADLALARRWVRACTQNHLDCSPLVQGSATATLHPRTRFIDVRLWRLVQLDEILLPVPLEYVALSYVWGSDAYQLRMVTANLAAFKRRLPESTSTGAERLPKTIVDAMLVTRALGYRFLWVDALCIVQDSREDLEDQLTQMGAIYALATTTIAARGSRSSDTGLPGVSVPRGRIGNSDCSWDSEVAAANGLCVGAWTFHPDEQYEEKHGALADKRCYIWRGWTFQEQILSTRSLEFSPQRMVLWCGRKMSRPDSGYSGSASEMYDPHHFRHAIRRYLSQKGAASDVGGSASGIDDRWLLARWNTIRDTYSTRSLTYALDRRRAIMGTAKVLNDVIGGIDSGGHIRTNLHTELLWYLDLKTDRAQKMLVKFSRDQAPDGLFPSWSWLNLWPVTWPALGEPLPDVTVRISSHSEVTSNTAVEIDARALELRLTETLDGGRKLVYPDGSPANITVRLDSVTETGSMITCVPLARGISIMWWEQELLLLRRVEEHYVRIGMGSLPEHDSERFSEYLYSEEGQRRVIVCY